MSDTRTSEGLFGKSPDNGIEVSFRVPQVHRVRFTQDVLGEERAVLLELLESDSGTPPKVLVCCDGNLAKSNRRIEQRLDMLSNDGGFELVGFEIVPGGEECKNEPRVIEALLDRVHAGNLDRRSYVVVIGGGAVLDAVGYAAAIAHRGIRLVRLPSTTLGQADSGIGVKNAVNRFGKKNWLGCFATPWGVINDRALLGTLSDRDFLAGFSEAVKVALLKSESFFNEVRDNAKAIRQRDPSVCAVVIRDSAVAHLRHITEGGDPFETETSRPLDFGHWSAHRLEALSGYELRHGEAVSIGLAIDAVYSALVHDLPASQRHTILETLLELGLPISCPLLRDSAPLLEGLEEFRQHLGGRLTVTMLRGIGDPIDAHEVDERAMRDAIATLAERS